MGRSPRSPILARGSTLGGTLSTTLAPGCDTCSLLRDALALRRPRSVALSLESSEAGLLLTSSCALASEALRTRDEARHGPERPERNREEQHARGAEEEERGELG